MNKKLSITYVAVALIALIGAIASLIVIRNINEKPSVVVEQSPSMQSSSPDTSPETPVIQQNVTFNGVDAIHWGRGSAKITGTEKNPKIVFGNDFEVAQGPDLFVYLSPNEAGGELGEYASLGNLKSNTGAQEYVLPQNYKDYKTLVIWCRAFGVTFATADLI